MATKFTLQNVGHPETRAIRPDEWKNLSTHASAKAAYKAYKQHTAHLSYGSWDDHYRVLDPNGNVIDMGQIENDIIYDETYKRMQREERKGWLR